MIRRGLSLALWVTLALLGVTSQSSVFAEDPERQRPAPGLSVTLLAPNGSAFDKGQGPQLFLLLENRGEKRPCLDITIDRILSPLTTKRRPLSRVTFDLRRSNGKHLKPGIQAPIDWAALDVRSLLTLHCGEGFGRMIALSSGEWGFKVPPGEYRVKATVETRVRSFLLARPDLMATLADDTGANLASLEKTWAEGVVESNTLVFTVR